MNEIYSEKVAIFIDGGYLNKVIKQYFDNTSLDYLKLSNKICFDLKVISAWNTSRKWQNKLKQ